MHLTVGHEYFRSVVLAMTYLKTQLFILTSTEHAGGLGAGSWDYLCGSVSTVY